MAMNQNPFAVGQSSTGAAPTSTLGVQQQQAQLTTPRVGASGSPAPAIFPSPGKLTKTPRFGSSGSPAPAVFPAPGKLLETPRIGASGNAAPALADQQSAAFAEAENRNDAIFQTRTQPGLINTAMGTRTRPTMANQMLRDQQMKAQTAQSQLGVAPMSPMAAFR